MSNKQNFQCKCKGCSASIDTEIWTSINISLNPEMEDEVKHQRVNHFTCEKCGELGFVDVSFLYHNPEKQFCAQYVSRDDLMSQEFYQTLTKTGTLQVGKEIQGVMEKMNDGSSAYITQPHFVFSTSEMAAFVLFRELCDQFGHQEIK